MHDGGVAGVAEGEEVEVLADDVRGGTGEGEGVGLFGAAEVVEFEDEVLGEEVGGAPEDPAEACIYQTVLFLP